MLAQSWQKCQYLVMFRALSRCRHLSCCSTSHSSVRHFPPHHRNQPGSNASTFSSPIESDLKSSNPQPKYLKSTSLCPQCQHQSFLISPCLFPLNSQLPCLQWLPLQSIFLTETKLNLFKCKSNMPAFLAKIQMVQTLPNSEAFPLLSGSQIQLHVSLLNVLSISSLTQEESQHRQAVRSFPALPSVFSSPCEASRPCMITSMSKCTVDYFRECSGTKGVKKRRQIPACRLRVRQLRTGWRPTQAQLLVGLDHLHCQLHSSQREAEVGYKR